MREHAKKDRGGQARNARARIDRLGGDFRSRSCFRFQSTEYHALTPDGERADAVGHSLQASGEYERNRLDEGNRPALFLELHLDPFQILAGFQQVLDGLAMFRPLEPQVLTGRI